MKKVIIASLIGIVPVAAIAQSGTNSPYSQYGMGELNNQAVGATRGMNGLGIAYHDHNQLNVLNPASYAYVDSLTLIFDAAIMGQVTNFKEGSTKVNANSADIEYAVGGFRLFKHLGCVFGILPYSNIGYEYTNTEQMGGTNANDETYYSNSFNGSGCFRQVFFGLGWEPLRGLALGANISYLWGSYNRYIENSYTDSYVNTLTKRYYASANTYKLDVGLQYTAKVTRHDEVTIGATYSNGHKIGADPRCYVISANSQTSVADTTLYRIINGLEIPETFGVGIMWNHAGKLRLGFDFTLQKWDGILYPVYDVIDEVPQYELDDGYYNDRRKYTIGGEYCDNEYSRNFFKRLRYRFGASYTTPYIKINGVDGPKEYSVSMGMGIPIVNSWNNRSILSITAQWVRQYSSTMITENTFRLTLGLTFNERWFAKWKME